MPCLHIDNLAYTPSFSSQRTTVSLFVWLTSPAFFLSFPLRVIGDVASCGC